MVIEKLRSHFVLKKKTQSAFELIYSEIVFQYKTNVIKKQRDKPVYCIVYHCETNRLVKKKTMQ